MAPRLTYDWNLQGYRTPQPGGEGFWGQQGQYLGTYPDIGGGGDPWGDMARAAGLAQYQPDFDLAALEGDPLWNTPSSPFFNQGQYRQQQTRPYEIPGTSRDRATLQRDLAARAGAPPAGYESPEFFTDPLDEPIWISGDEARTRGFNVSPFVSSGLKRVIEGTRRQFETPEGTAAAIAASPQSTNLPKPGLLDGILGMLAPFIPVLGPIAMAANAVDKMRTGGSILPVITNLVSAVAPAFGGIGLPMLGSLPGAAAGALGPGLAGQIGTGLGVATGLAGAAQSKSPLGALQALAPLGFQALSGTGFFGPGTDGGGGGGTGVTPSGAEGAFNLAGTGPGVFQGQFDLGGTGLMPPQVQAPSFGSSAPQFGGGFSGLPQFSLGGVSQPGANFQGSLGDFGTQGAPPGGVLASQLASRGVGPLSTQTIGAPEQPGVDWMSILENLGGLAGLLGGGAQQGDQETIINRSAGASGFGGFEPFQMGEQQQAAPGFAGEAFAPSGLKAGPTETGFQPPPGQQGGPMDPFGIFARDPRGGMQPYPGLSFPGPYGTGLLR